MKNEIKTMVNGKKMIINGVEIEEKYWKNQKIVNGFFEEKFTKLKAPLIQGTYLQWIDFRALGLRGEELKKFMNYHLKKVL